MKFLQIITQSENIGGASIHLIDLAKRLKDDGHEIIVAAGGGGELKERIEKNENKYVSLSYLVRDINPWNDVRATVEIYKLIKQEVPDLVCLHSSKAGLLGRIASFMAGVPNTFTVHGWAFTEGKNKISKFVYKIIEKSGGMFSKQIICVSKFDYNLGIKKDIVSTRKLNIVQNGIFEEPIVRNNKDKKTVKLIMVARFEDQKDQELLIRALSNLKDQKWQLEFVGDGSNLPKMKNLAKDLEVNNKINFLGFRKDVKNLLSQADIFVLTSNYEGLPITILEAMRAKLPVVASDVGGVVEQVKDGQTGFTIQGKDINKLTKSLNALISDKELREEMGTNGYELFREQFTFEGMYQKTLGVYEKAIEG